MTQPAKVQEPSMEEILASIRRIIADDEAKPSEVKPSEAKPAEAKAAARSQARRRREARQPASGGQAGRPGRQATGDSTIGRRAQAGRRGAGACGQS